MPIRNGHQQAKVVLLILVAGKLATEMTFRSTTELLLLSDMYILSLLSYIWGPVSGKSQSWELIFSSKYKQRYYIKFCSSWIKISVNELTEHIRRGSCISAINERLHKSNYDGPALKSICINAPLAVSANVDSDQKVSNICDIK